MEAAISPRRRAPECCTQDCLRTGPREREKSRKRPNTCAGERPVIPQPRGVPSHKTSSAGGASGCTRQRPLATAPGGLHTPNEPVHLQHEPQQQSKERNVNKEP